MKRLFFIVLILASIPSVWCQPVIQSMVAHSDLPGNIQKTIIRELDFPRTVSYVETNNGHFFVYHYDNVTPLVFVNLGNNYSVNDFVIDNDSVFFCGRNTSDNMGFVGQFGIQDFFHTSHLYRVTDLPFNSAQGQVVTFTKMVSFSVGQARKMAAIGRTSSGGHCVAEVWYDPSVSGYAYNVGCVSTTAQETFLDITVVANQAVVTAGFKVTNQGIHPVVRLYRPTSMFQANGPQDSYWLVNYSSFGVTNYDTSQLVMSYFQKDRFTMATYWRTPNMTTNKGVLASILTFGNGLSSLYHCMMETVQYYGSGGWKLRGLTPPDATGHFYLLQNAELPGGGPLVNMVCELNTSLFNPFSTSFSMRVLQDPLLQSIDGKLYGQGFVTNGVYKTIPYRLGYYDASASSTNCFLPYTHNCTGDDEDPLNYYPDPFVVVSDNNTSQVHTGIRMDQQINLDCIETGKKEGGER